MLNKIWTGMLIAAVISTLYGIFMGDSAAAGRAMDAFFSSADSAVKIAIGLSGLMCIWLGISRVAENSGITEVIARILTPLFRAIMPEIPAGHRAISSITMNLSANMLGLDNAATPLGIKAMKDLQSINPDPQTASNAEIMFLVINTSAVTIFPVSIFMYRAQMGSVAPTEVFVPLLLATLCSTIAGFLVTAAVQKISLLRWPIFLALILVISFVGAVAAWGIHAGAGLSEESKFIANLCLLCLIGTVFFWALIKRINAFESFIEGAREGFKTAIDILPYLIAMLFAIALFRASGALDFLLDGLRWVVSLVTSDTRFVDSLPVAIAKPLSGSGARAMMIDVFNTFGVDSFQGKVASIMMGSTETTFYVLAVYFGSVGIIRARHAVACGLVADFTAMTASVIIGYIFFG